MFLRFVFTASDLDCIRALFNEKEKELSLAVAKVEELTRQLEELRGRQNAAGTGSGGGGAGGVGGGGVGGGGGGGHLSTPASAELEKLRRELIVSEQTSLSLPLSFFLGRAISISQRGEKMDKREFIYICVYI